MDRDEKCRGMQNNEENVYLSYVQRFRTASYSMSEKHIMSLIDNFVALQLQVQQDTRRFHELTFHQLHFKASINFHSSPHIKIQLTTIKNVHAHQLLLWENEKKP